MRLLRPLLDKEEENYRKTGYDDDERKLKKNFFII
jgi:hypothetical protein